MRRYREGISKAIYAGIGSGMLLCFALLLLAAVLSALGYGHKSLPKIFSLAQFLAAARGGYVGGRRAGRRGYIVGGIVGLSWGIILVALSSLVGTVLWREWWGKLGLYFLLGAAGGIWGVNQD